MKRFFCCANLKNESHKFMNFFGENTSNELLKAGV